MTKTENTFDVAILGTGPAGLQAAIHSARRKVKVVVFGKVKKSAALKAHIENYCCINEKVSGEELLLQGRKMSERFGAKFIDQDVVGITQDEDGNFILETEAQERFGVHSVVFALGTSRKKLNVPGEKELTGKGVSYCVDCDGFFYKNKTVAVVGNESAAAAGALTLLMVADKVYWICREADVNDALKNQIEKSDIETRQGAWVKAIEGNDHVETLVLDSPEGETLSVDGVFIELGAKGAIDLAALLGVELDRETYSFIVTNKSQETNVPGIYAAGDICGPPWQVAKAVGEGCVAGLEAAAFAKKRKKA